MAIGDQLREAREAQDRTIEEAARALRIRAEYVEALEDEAFEVFGADTYARGHLRNYAKFLGLDPEVVLEEYRRQHGTDDQITRRIATGTVASHAPREPAPAWLTWGIVVVAVIALIVLIGQVFGSRTPAAVDDLPTSPVSGAPTATTSATPSPTPSETPSPTESFDGVNLLLIFEGDSWLEAKVDGADVVAGEVVSAGDTRLFEGTETISIRLGSAGAVLVEFNGQNLGPAGDPGQVVVLTFTPDGPTSS